MIQFKAIRNLFSSHQLPHCSVGVDALIAEDHSRIAKFRRAVLPDPARRPVTAVFQVVVQFAEDSVRNVVTIDKPSARRSAASALTQLHRLFHVGLLYRLTSGGAPLRGSVPHLIEVGQ